MTIDTEATATSAVAASLLMGNEEVMGLMKREIWLSVVLCRYGFRRAEGARS